MSKIIVDTDILIDFLRGREKAKTFLSKRSKESTLCCSVVTIAEIYAGMLEKEKERTEDLLEGLFVVPVSIEIAKTAGILRRETKAQGLELDDCLIAATACVEDAALATMNRRHFPFKEIRLDIP